MSNNIYVWENSLKVYLKETNLERVGRPWFWQSFSMNGPILLRNRKHASLVCSYLAVSFSSCHQTWLCMTPAALWPFCCLPRGGLARWTAAADFSVSTVSVHLLFSLRKRHVNQKISAMNVSSAARHDSTQICALRLGAFLSEAQRHSIGAPAQAVLFFYWNCTEWMFCARVKCHFNTKAGVFFVAPAPSAVQANLDNIPRHGFVESIFLSN